MLPTRKERMKPQRVDSIMAKDFEKDLEKVGEMGADVEGEGVGVGNHSIFIEKGVENEGGEEAEKGLEFEEEVQGEGCEGIEVHVIDDKNDLRNSLKLYDNI
jgi:hypothetical protein